MEGTLTIRNGKVYVRKCCGTEILVDHYLTPLEGKAVRLEQHCDGSFRIVPLDRDRVQVNTSLLRVQHGERTTRYADGNAREAAICRICGQPVGGM